ncbi:hypothetical protein RRF57_005080 [Xylaria bambusicola]|uniref:DUF7514 domain-containing protein n=1 Tax=Xylaria bambusicola TaxID=326684 RepID=A0AAN7UKG5_9PEZI
MTNGKPQTQALLSKSGAPDSLGSPMETTTRTETPSTTGLVTSSGQSSSDIHVLREQNKSVTSPQRSEPRPALESGGFSPNFMDEIRRLIKQETRHHHYITFRWQADMRSLVLGACTMKDRSQNPTSEGDSASLVGADASSNNITQESRRLPHLTTANKPAQDESDDGSSSPATLPGSGSDHVPTPETTPTPTPSPPSTVSVPPLSLDTPVAAKPDPRVRFSDNVTLTRNAVSAPAKKAPWTMYRRMSSSSGETVPDWGVLFDANGYSTARCGQVLRGLAKYMAEEFSPRGTVVVTPEKLGVLYSRFKIEGEVHPFEGEHPFAPTALRNTLSGFHSFELLIFAKQISSISSRGKKVAAVGPRQVPIVG